MRNILHRGPRFAALLLLLPALVFVASLFWHIVPAPANTSYYRGPALDIPYCQVHGGSCTCENGSITGSVTTSGTSVVSWAFDSDVASLNSGSAHVQAVFIGTHFTDGYMDGGYFQVANSFLLDNPVLGISGGSPPFR